MNGQRSHQHRGDKPKHRDERPRHDRPSIEEHCIYSHFENIKNFQQTPQIEDLLTCLKDFVKIYGGYVTTSQLRNIFARVKPMKTRQELQLIRPRIAYVAARQNSQEARDVVNFLETVISKIENDAQVKNFIAFFEAIVAYHKFYESDKKQSKS